MTLARPKTALVALLVIAGIGLWFQFGSGRGKPNAEPRDPADDPSREAWPGGKIPSAQELDDVPKDSPFSFTWMTPQSGVDFRYYGAPTPRAYMTEQNGGGVGLLDYDRDGTLDLFLVNGSDFAQPASGLNASNRLYRSTGPFQYEDVTQAAGLVAHGFGMGCASGDYDNDGFADLFVASYGRDRLWRNNGDGTFTEVTDFAGVGGMRWGTSAAFADLDDDGLSDLYVVNYIEWSSDEPPCHPFNHPEIKTVCSPMERPGQADFLYRNLGDGRFAEIGAAAGIDRADDGKGLALEIADFDGDGRLDVYVVNDTTPNFLFRNLGNMTFEEVGILQGVAVSGNGSVGSGMGVASADYDHNGYLDLCVTNYRNQVNDVYANLGPSGFVATNTELGIDLVSRLPLGFGIVLADFNLDSWPDLFVANGHIMDLTSLGPGYEYQMHPQVLWNQSGRRFTDVSGISGEYFAKRWLGRSVAAGDLDNDGDTDLVVTHIQAPPALLRNDSPRAGGSLRVELVGIGSARQPLGRRVTVVNGQRRQISHVPSGGSFQASHDPRVLLPAGPELTEIEVEWSPGRVEVYPAVGEHGELLLIEGTGKQPARPREAAQDR